MRQFRNKRYWLIGASEGLGASLARLMSDAGAELVLSARSEEALQKVAESLSGASMVVPLDVSDKHSVQDAVQQVGEVDGLVYLAAAYWPMDGHVLEADKAIVMMDVNFNGVLRVLDQVLPMMRAKGSGHIVLTGSLAAFRGLPGAVGYGSSKAAMQSLAETLTCDLSGTGIDIQISHPGFIRTRLTDKNDFPMPSIMEPEEAADHMFRHMQSRRFQKSFPWGFSRIFRFARIIPDWMFFRLFA